MVPCRCCQKTTLLILGVIMPFKVCQHNHYLWIVPYIFFLGKPTYFGCEYAILERGLSTQPVFGQCLNFFLGEVN
ncbi:Os03g0844301 [Oryza sativa Japonica Group]|uniref:Os03g0844301 protein n=1 Tax=Oryza sativa subsp. japonica TaxID=39947 RepID=A0A0P0W5F8_ORYSJ|nr:hypothetical protein EE612_021617 [Oryza sativa]BAS87325.1 Os03g0844301 [Oryza sativa Japonica Group]